MKVIIEKIIENKIAKLVLADEVTVQVWYDDKLIDESAGGTWYNISNGLEEGYLNIIIESYIEETYNSFDEEFETMKGELD